MSVFQANFLKSFDFFRQFKKNFDFPGKNCSFTATPWQIILYLFKSHHFLTYFQYMIKYNNISRSVHDPLQPPFDAPTTPSAQNLGVATALPNPQGLTPLAMSPSNVHSKLCACERAHRSGDERTRENFKRT